MTLNSLGENGFVEVLKSRFNSSLPKNVLAGIGDDCAVTQLSDGLVQLISCDMLNEGTHFELDQTSPEELGYKSLAVNLSDIAAMGGFPESAFLSLGLPQSTSKEWLDAFFNGVQELADSTQTLLLGGDLTRSSSLLISFTVIGKANSESICYRNQALPGDLLCTTGVLGNAGAGLRLLQNEIATANLPQDSKHTLIKSLLKPRPHLEQGQWLAQKSSVHAMMDLSDGIRMDLPRLAVASNVGALVHLEQLPLSPELRKISSMMNWNMHELAACAGEDYCLLLTVDKEAYSNLNRHYNQKFGEHLFVIGEITKESQESVTYLKRGVLTLLSAGFDHFSPK